MSHSLSLFCLRAQIIFVKQLKKKQSRQRYYHSIHSRRKKNKGKNSFCCPGIINVSWRHPVKGKQEHFKTWFLFNVKTLILLTCQHSLSVSSLIFQETVKVRQIYLFKNWFIPIHLKPTSNTTSRNYFHGLFLLKKDIVYSLFPSTAKKGLLVSFEDYLRTYSLVIVG